MIVMLCSVDEKDIEEHLIVVPDETISEPNTPRTTPTTATPPFPSPWLVILQLLLMLGVAATIWTPWAKVKPYCGFISDGQVSWIAFMNGSLTIAYFILAWFLSRQHTKALKFGLLAFTWETKHLRQFPSWALAVGNVSLLMLWSLWPTDAPVDVGGVQIYSRVNAAQCLVSLEVTFV